MPTEIEEMVRDAYADERFLLTYEEVIARSGKRRRRWLAPMAAVTAAASVVAGVVVAVGQLSGPKTDPAAEAEFAAACASTWTVLAKNDPRLTPQHQENGLPNLVASYLANGLGLRVYAFDSIMFGCTRDASGQVSGVIRGDERNLIPFLSAPIQPGDISYLAVLDPSGGPEYLVGMRPTGVDRVVATTAGRKEIEAKLTEKLFVVWSPTGGLKEARVDAYLGNQRIAQSDQPSVLIGVISDAYFTERCRSVVEGALRGVTGLSDDAIANAAANPIFTLHEGSRLVWLYAALPGMTECVLTGDGHFGAPTTYTVQDTTKAISPTTMGLGGLSWVFGLVGPGTERVDLHLPDGRVIPAQVNGRYFAAAWYWPNGDYRPAPEPSRIVAYTADRVYTLAGGKITQQPR